MSGWFNSLGWWDQIKAFEAFHADRASPVNGNLNHAIENALPIIRVVFSTQKVKVARAGDEDDLISAAAFTITKAIPKMAIKPPDKLGNDKQYMRYLFTCVVNAFLRELDVLHGKSNKVQKRLLDAEYVPPQKHRIQSVEAKMVLNRLPNHVYLTSRELIRFTGKQKQACEYILSQLLHDREIAKAVLNLLDCGDKDFYTRYCRFLIYLAVRALQQAGIQTTDSLFLDNTTPMAAPPLLSEGCYDAHDFST